MTVRSGGERGLRAHRRSGPLPPTAPVSDGGLTTYHVQGNVWVIAGAGGNITVQASSDAKAAGLAPATACCWWTPAAKR